MPADAAPTGDSAYAQRFIEQAMPFVDQLYGHRDVAPRAGRRRLRELLVDVSAHRQRVSTVTGG